MGGTLTVKVKMDGDKIAAIEILNHQETPGVSDPAIKDMPAAILEKQSADVDIITGATITSNAIKAAVADALAKR